MRPRAKRRRWLQLERFATESTGDDLWQVAGQVSLGTTSDFKGILLCKTLIAANTSAVITGRALAQTAVTLIANTVTAP